MPPARRHNVTLDDPTDEVLRRVARPGQEAAYIRAAVHEKAARDEQRSEIDELRASNEQLRQRLQRVERQLSIQEP